MKKIISAILGLFVLIFLYVAIHVYPEVRKDYDLMYGPYYECKECIAKGQSDYQCALKVADNKDYNYLSSNQFKKETESFVENRTKNLIEKCSTKSTKELMDDSDLFIPTDERTRRDIGPIEDEIKKACADPKAATIEYIESQTSDSICHFSALEDYQGNVIRQKPGPIKIFFESVGQLFAGVILYAVLLLGGEMH